MLLEPGKRGAQRNQIVMFLLCPEGLAEQRNFSSCVEGDHEAVSSLPLLPSPSQLDGHSYAATVLSISLAAGKMLCHWQEHQHSSSPRASPTQELC